MKLNWKIGICALTFALVSVAASAQETNIRADQRAIDSLAVVKEQSRTQEASDQSNISDLKDKRSRARSKAKEARRSEKVANTAAKEAKDAYKSEKRAQKARSNADKQAKKAARAKDKVD